MSGGLCIKCDFHAFAMYFTSLLIYVVSKITTQNQSIINFLIPFKEMFFFLLLSNLVFDTEQSK